MTVNPFENEKVSRFLEVGRGGGVVCSYIAVHKTWASKLSFIEIWNKSKKHKEKQSWQRQCQWSRLLQNVFRVLDGGQVEHVRNVQCSRKLELTDFPIMVTRSLGKLSNQVTLTIMSAHCYHGQDVESEEGANTFSHCEIKKVWMVTFAKNKMLWSTVGRVAKNI